MTTISSDSLPVHLGGATLDRPRHACAFFRNRDEEYRVLLPFILEGFVRGDKAFHIIRPTQIESHLHRLAAAGIDVNDAQDRRQLEILKWEEAYLRGGRFDPDAMLEMMEEVLLQSRANGFPLTRVIGGAEWALEASPCIDDLIDYETRLNYVMPNYDDAVACTYDLSKFGAEAVMDAFRTHRVVIVGGSLHENPFFVPPDAMLDELRTRALP
jgi:hypothetical protein